MRPSFQFDFEELPLVIENSFEAGLVAGNADISYGADGEWNIESISLDGHRKPEYTDRERVDATLAGKALPFFERKPVLLDAGTPIYLAIYHRLENEWRDAVQNAVNDQIEGDRESEADTAGDRRREREFA